MKAIGRLSAVVSATALLVVPVSSALAADNNPGNNITICHGTNSDTNPYVVNSPNANGDVSGHAGHTGPVWAPGLKDQHIAWGDIIPPFDYNNDGQQAHFPGLNWDANGQAWWHNNCQVPITVTVDKTNDANGDATYSDDETASSVGASVTFKVVITNTSVVPAVLSSLIDMVSGSAQAFTCADNIIGSTLAAGESATCLFTLTGYSPADGASLVDTVTATLHEVGNEENNGSASDDSTVRTFVPNPDVSIIKTGPATAAPGDNLTWTLTVHNDGNVVLSDVAVSDTLPADTTFVSAAGTDWTCTGTTTVSCTYDTDLGIDGSSFVTIVATLDPAFTGTTISNTAVVTPNDSTPGDNTSTVTTTVTQPTGGGGGTTTGGGGGTTTGETPGGTTGGITGGGGGTLPFNGLPTVELLAMAMALVLFGSGLLLLTPRRQKA